MEENGAVIQKDSCQRRVASAPCRFLVPGSFSHGAQPYYSFCAWIPMPFLILWCLVFIFKSWFPFSWASSSYLIKTIICICYSQHLPKWSGPTNLGVKWYSASLGGIGETPVGNRMSGDQSQFNPPSRYKCTRRELNAVFLRGLHSEQAELIDSLPWQFLGEYVDLRSKYGSLTSQVDL